VQRLDKTLENTSEENSVSQKKGKKRKKKGRKNQHEKDKQRKKQKQKQMPPIEHEKTYQTQTFFSPRSLMPLSRAKHNFLVILTRSRNLFCTPQGHADPVCTFLRKPSSSSMSPPF
jgi:transposase-like protein